MEVGPPPPTPLPHGRCDHAHSTVSSQLQHFCSKVFPNLPSTPAQMSALLPHLTLLPSSTPSTGEVISRVLTALYDDCAVSEPLTSFLPSRPQHSPQHTLGPSSMFVERVSEQ